MKKIIKTALSLFVGALALTSCGGDGGASKKFAPKDRTTSTMTDSERQAAIAAKKASLTIDPAAMMASNDVKMSIMPPFPEGDLNEQLSERIGVKMLEMISQNGIGGLNTVPGFALTAKITPGEKTTTGTAPTKYIAKYEISYSVINTVTGDVYASANQEITGVGNSFQQATRNAVNEIKNSPEIQAMLSKASTKIIAWFEDNLDTFKGQVNDAYSKEDYALALSLIQSVPQKATTAFKYAQSRRDEVNAKFLNQVAANELIALKEAIGAANGTMSPEVYAHMAMLPKTSAEYKTARGLIEKYETDVVKTTAEREKRQMEKEELEAQRAQQVELANIEAERLKAKYQAQATTQALRQHMREKDDKERGFWGNLGARLIGAIDKSTDDSANKDDFSDDK